MQSDEENRNSIFQAINFFRELEDKLGGNNVDTKLNEAEREVEFLRGRLA